MPPLAHTKPCCVSVMTTPFSIRTTRFASRSTTSTWRASRSQRRRTRRPRAAARWSSGRRCAPSAFDTIFWVTTRTSSSRSGRTAGRAASASAISAGRSSPGTISPRPSIATASIRSATDRLGRLVACGRGAGRRACRCRAQRAVELDDGAPAAARGLDVGRVAVAAEAEVDHVGRGEQERVRPAAVPVGDDRDERGPVRRALRDERRRAAPG